MRNIRLLTKCAAVFGLIFMIHCQRLSVEQKQWSMGYWTGWDGDPESAFVWRGITHIIHWGVVHPGTNGTLTFLCSGGTSCTQAAFVTFASGIIGTAHANHVNVILSLSETNLSAAISSSLAAFVANIMAVVNGAGYDGVEIDWEHSQNWTQYASLLTSLRASLGTARTLTGTTYGENNSFWATQTTNGTVDRVNFMTYDMQGGGKPYSWFNSALYSDSCNCVLSWDLDRSRITGAGVPANKLNLGIPFYGYLETGVNGPRQTGETGATQVNYKAAATRYNITQPTYDKVAHEPWIAVGRSSWLGFENAQSITDKVNYAKAHGLGGWVIFNLSADYLPTQNPQHPLLAAVAAAMRGGSATNFRPNQLH
jgi:chitinase